MKRPFGSGILDAASRLLIPYILLFALYVLFHGHHSPGGGFQGGTMLAAAVILLRLTRGREPGWGPSRRQCAYLALLGVGIYASMGLAALLCGANFLDYGALPLPVSRPQARSLGILGIEIGVTVGVMGTMILIFDLLTDEGKADA